MRQHIHDPVGSVILAGRGIAAHHLCRALQGRSWLHRIGDVAFLVHGREHQLGAVFGKVRVARRGIAGRRFQEAGDGRRLGDGHQTRGFAEIAPGRGIDPIGPRTEIDPVEIHFEDLVLGIFGFQPEGEHQFLDLALDGAVRFQKQVLGQLLGQGRPALLQPSGGQIGVTWRGPGRSGRRRNASGTAGPRWRSPHWADRAAIVRGGQPRRPYRLRLAISAPLPATILTLGGRAGTCHSEVGGR